jgi:hypothetical protein
MPKSYVCKSWVKSVDIVNTIVYSQSNEHEAPNTERRQGQHEPSAPQVPRR